MTYNAVIALHRCMTYNDVIALYRCMTVCNDVIALHRYMTVCNDVIALHRCTTVCYTPLYDCDVITTLLHYTVVWRITPTTTPTTT